MSIKLEQAAEAFGFSGEEQVSILKAFSDMKETDEPAEFIAFADGFGGGGVAGINVLGGTAPSGIPGDAMSMGAAGADSDKTDQNDMNAAPSAKEEKKEEKAEAKAEKKSEAEAKSEAAPVGDPEAAKASLKTIADKEDVEKGVKKDAEDLSAKIDEAQNAVSKLLKEVTVFTSKNAPKPEEKKEGEEKSGAPAA